MIQRVRVHESMHGPSRREPAFDIDDDGVATQPPMSSLPTPLAVPIAIPVVQQISSLGLVSQNARTESPNKNNSDASRNLSTTSTTSAKKAYRNALAIRREAIAREMRGIREYATEFQRPRLPFPGIDNNSRNSEDHADSLSLSFAAEELKQQIGSLQTQVERLQVVTAALAAPPPAYDEEVGVVHAPHWEDSCQLQKGLFGNGVIQVLSARASDKSCISKTEE
ncbi:predicted protein [Postia placenta Mad-698-R]|nr:predicted protein [Postia placenta Mad-698-R]